MSVFIEVEDGSELEVFPTKNPEDRIVIRGDVSNLEWSDARKLAFTIIGMTDERFRKRNDKRKTSKLRP